MEHKWRTLEGKAKADARQRKKMIEDDFAYEVGMLRELTRTLSFRTPEEIASIPVGVVRDALTESYAVHLRNLIEFFTTSPRGLRGESQSTVLAGDFLGAGVVLAPLSPEDAKTLDDAYVQACKEVSHPTWDRVDNPEGGTGWYSKPGTIVLSRVEAFDLATKGVRTPPESRPPAVRPELIAAALRRPAIEEEPSTTTSTSGREPMTSGFSSKERRRFSQ
jgi:hypothetical protein